MGDYMRGSLIFINPHVERFRAHGKQKRVQHAIPAGVQSQLGPSEMRVAGPYISNSQAKKKRLNFFVPTNIRQPKKLKVQLLAK